MLCHVQQVLWILLCRSWYLAGHASTLAERASTQARLALNPQTPTFLVLNPHAHAQCSLPPLFIPHHLVSSSHQLISALSQTTDLRLASLSYAHRSIHALVHWRSTPKYAVAANIASSKLDRQSITRTVIDPTPAYCIAICICTCIYLQAVTAVKNRPRGRSSTSLLPVNLPWATVTLTLTRLPSIPSLNSLGGFPFSSVQGCGLSSKQAVVFTPSSTLTRTAIHRLL